MNTNFRLKAGLPNENTYSRDIVKVKRRLDRRFVSGTGPQTHGRLALYEGTTGNSTRDGCARS